MNYEQDTWKIIDSYFEKNPNYLTKHHLDSYNDFITNKIPQTFQQYNPQILYKELIEINKILSSINIYNFKLTKRCFTCSFVLR